MAHRAAKPQGSQRRCQALLTVAYTTSDALPRRHTASTERRQAFGAGALHRAALLARLSGLCYYPPEQLAERLQEEDMKLVTSGGTSFTRQDIQTKAQLQGLSK